jgi:hypothetical protein
VRERKERQRRGKKQKKSDEKTTRKTRPSTKKEKLHSSNSPRLPPHQPHEPHAAVRARRLYLSRQQGPLRLLDRRVEAEAAVDQKDVVVDRLGHADDGADDAGALALVVDRVCRGVAAVATDNVELGDA